MYNAVCKWLLAIPENKDHDRVDVFALKEFAGRRNALKKYLSKYAGRVKILESAPRVHLSDPANRIFTHPGLDRGIDLIFVRNYIRSYKLRLSTFQWPKSDKLNVGEMEKLRGLLIGEIKYLGGCNVQWRPSGPEPAGKFSSLAMLQDKALTFPVRAGASGCPGSKESGDESSSSVEVVGVQQLPTGGAAALGSRDGEKASENGYIGLWWVMFPLPMYVSLSPL